MKIDLDGTEAAKVVVGAVATLLTAVFGRDVKAMFAAWRRRRAQRGQVEEQRAAVELAAAKLEESEFRRTDDALSRAAGRAERAEKARDEALELLRAARDDVHDVKNAAMVDMAATRKSAEAEIARIQHAAETKIALAEQKVADAQQRIQVLMEELAQRDVAYAELTVRHQDCIKRNEELSALLNRRMDAQHFDPARTNL